MPRKRAKPSTEDLKYLEDLNAVPSAHYNYRLPNKIERRFIRVGWAKITGDGYTLTNLGKSVLRMSPT